METHVHRLVRQRDTPRKKSSRSFQLRRFLAPGRCGYCLTSAYLPKITQPAEFKLISLIGGTQV
jgi:hypothetical protein